MPKQSAGILLYHFHEDELKVFLVHPGGPFWKNKEDGAWSIPKGEFDESENAFACAKREFMEETGIPLKAENYMELNPVKMKSGKIIHAWAAEGHVIPEEISSNMFELKWKNGQTQSFPEVDKANWFSIDEAKRKIVPAQSDFLNQLAYKLQVGK
jgi:predicted NUDIX family NTP pyrophosphohydrolase